MQPTLTKYDRLQEILKGIGPVLVAFSGGVDSALLLRAAVDALADRAVAVTISSPFSPIGELEGAKNLAAQLGARHIVLEIDPLAMPDLAANPPDRCYLCKLVLMRRCLEIATEHGLAAVVEGSNLDDLADYRPGKRALEELGIKSPLLAAGLSKAEIRELSHSLGLPTWDKPSMACLASRFPYGTTLTAEGLTMVGQAEAFLAGRGFRIYRVRHHGDTARLELGEAELARALENNLRQEIVAALKGLGFRYVTLDLQGYRSGSMN